MTGENKTFKKLPSLGTLNIPSPEDIPHSPGYKRQGFLFFEFHVIKEFCQENSPSTLNWRHKYQWGSEEWHWKDWGNFNKFKTQNKSRTFYEWYFIFSRLTSFIFRFISILIQMSLTNRKYVELKSKLTPHIILFCQ